MLLQISWKLKRPQQTDKVVNLNRYANFKTIITEKIAAMNTIIIGGLYLKQYSPF